MKNQIYPQFIVFLFFILVPIISIRAQDLTKEETVNYINKKLKEALDHGVYTDTHGYLLDQSFKLEGDFIIFSQKRATSTGSCYSSKDYTKAYESFEYESRIKANYIKQTKEISTPSNPSIGKIEISFHPKLVKSEKVITIGTHTHYWKKVYNGVVHYGERLYDEISDYKTECNTSKETLTITMHPLYFVKESENSGSKLIKALTHLIDLYKAEDDPFGN